VVLVELVDLQELEAVVVVVVVVLSTCLIVVVHKPTIIKQLVEMVERAMEHM
jgi:hypothetical protein